MAKAKRAFCFIFMFREEIDTFLIDPKLFHFSGTSLFCGNQYIRNTLRREENLSWGGGAAETIKIRDH